MTNEAPMPSDGGDRRTSASSFVRHSAKGGFTLLEMVLAMFILSLLIGAIFTIVRSVTQLANEMTMELQRDGRTHGFLDLCSRTFRSLPPEAWVRLRTKQAGGRYLSQLVLTGGASPLSGQTGGITVLETEEVPDGYFRLAMRVLTPEQAVAWEKGDAAVGIRLPLLENVATLDWKFLNMDTGEWEPLWNDKLDLQSLTNPQTDGVTGAPVAPIVSRRPSLVELKLAFGAEPPQRHVFWVPPAAPPSPLKRGNILEPRSLTTSPELPPPNPIPP
jgi:prepilin-type N-terminal cleavage/methylation domain-containing protein